MSSPVIDFHIHPISYEHFDESALNWVKGLHANKNWPEFYEANRDPGFLPALKENSVDYGVVIGAMSGGNGAAPMSMF